jgi:hypothetical protein
VISTQALPHRANRKLSPADLSTTELISYLAFQTAGGLEQWQSRRAGANMVGAIIRWEQARLESREEQVFGREGEWGRELFTQLLSEDRRLPLTDIWEPHDVWTHDGFYPSPDPAGSMTLELVDGTETKNLTSWVSVEKYLALVLMKDAQIPYAGPSSMRAGMADMFIDFVVETYGENKIPALLAAIGHHKTLKEVLHEALDIELPEVEIAWVTWLGGRYGEQ